MNVRQLFLLIAAVGLIPIALSYGVTPQKSLNFLFGIDASAKNSRHIFRALMGLYLALALFWIMGALDVQLRQASLYSFVVFMLGLAAGRILSIMVDGLPHWLLVVYLGLEICFGAIGLALLINWD